MKKSLLILPLLAFIGGALAGCGGDDPKDGPSDDVDDSKLGPAEVFGHARATKLEDGKSYYFGITKWKGDEDQEVWLINGEPHSDKNGVYPFYMSETKVQSADDFANLAKISVHYVAGSTTKFNLKIEKEGATNDGKYISVYNTISTVSNKPVLSIHCADEIGETFTEEVPQDEGDPIVNIRECYYNFEWFEEYSDYVIKTVGISFIAELSGDEEATPKFFGTDNQYKSVDCKNGSKAMDEAYNLAYFYEV